MDIPLCPITGEPARRLVQWVDARLLTDLWRITFKTDSRPSFRGVERFGLWESPCGLYFFDPLREGDAGFYHDFYTRLRALSLFGTEDQRAEFAIAAKSIAEGARVLDVGCGLASFRHCVPQAHYTGLDPNLSLTIPGVDLRKESITDHVVTHPGEYDAVCAFQVIEHLDDPRTFFHRMIEAVKPGGLVIIGVPHVPSPMTRIPNFILNAPPHHLTWWTVEALATLAKGGGLDVESIEEMPWSDPDAPIYWIEKSSFIKGRDQHFRGHWLWHAAAFGGLIGGYLLNALFKTPSTVKGGGLLLIARKPG
ncbi:class I SAM-dependent methyltransferase [Beijerinckia indica]|uniref:Methyltransferase type 12 n=1 Tax=Beijerinckia indica subsp. indica (strain ATCC 9039 / DSM 1715 / NCIMB 8712) TaxID=395963 RepID=B2IE77_BEII9|nr:class I SAM-dependent methyltransferase [Beijerinckia indica]ACB94101.1 Methyltransferase type 12 [Beijerinckia indica subsp. indica ATCC 9039]